MKARKRAPVRRVPYSVALHGNAATVAERLRSRGGPCVLVDGAVPALWPDIWRRMDVVDRALVLVMFAAYPSMRKTLSFTRAERAAADRRAAAAALFAALDAPSQNDVLGVLR